MVAAAVVMEAGERGREVEGSAMVCYWGGLCSWVVVVDLESGPWGVSGYPVGAWLGCWCADSIQVDFARLFPSSWRCRPEIVIYLVDCLNRWSTVGGCTKPSIPQDLDSQSIRRALYNVNGRSMTQ